MMTLRQKLLQAFEYMLDARGTPLYEDARNQYLIAIKEYDNQ